MSDEQEQNPELQKNGGFESGVAGLRLGDILELKERSGFHGLLVVQFQKKMAKIYFDHGSLQHLEAADQVDEAALRTILKWPGGKIKVLPKMEYPRRTMSRSLSEVLVEEGLRLPGQQPQPIPPERQQAAGPRSAEEKADRHWTPQRRVGVFGVMAVLLTLSVLLGSWVFLRSPVRNANATNPPSEMAAPSAPVTRKLFAIHGSNTIGSRLAPNLAVAFLREAGATQVDTVETAPEEMLVSGYFAARNRIDTIEIKAHGSRTSFAGLNEESCDIGMASRPIKEEERLKLIRFGDLASPSAEQVLAMDGLAVIVHPANGLNALSVAELAQLFSGKIADWSEIPGSGLSGPVNIYARDDKSGTYDTFKSLVLKPNKLKLSPVARRFEDSQELAEANGFVDLSIFEQARKLDRSEEVPSTYLSAHQEARRLSVNFRFRSGKADLDNKAVQDMQRIVDYLGRENNRNRTIRLFGFADNLGGYSQNCEISRERAEHVERVLEVYGIYPNQVVGLCDAMPVASNASSRGREKNRRVEIWVN